jgi:hypothetical protein
MNTSQLSLLERREIEALMAVPLIKAYAKELGFEKAVDIATSLIQDLARKAGQEIAESLGSNAIADLARVVHEIWARDGALEITILEQTENTFVFNVTRCRYVEAYDRLRVKDFGLYLSCSRDGAFSGGFNSRLKLTRTQTIMEGAPHCDFHFKVE